jgi:D-galactonate transporter|uniref:Putative tartrate transporter n=1 Tax=Acidicaldus sp. TaxID=1872105 RepID=A0A8J4HAP8_9PROT
MDDLEARTMAKVMRRLVPFLILCYFAAYLDRVNVGFAALTMIKDLHLTATAFGFGAGIFFIAYFVFEVPSNLALDRFGASRWIARIMVTWGICSGAMAFIQGETSFYVVRTLLGAAEAGFFPGIIFYLTLWFPGVYRGRIIGYFMAAIPLSTVIGAPVSGFILYMGDTLGLRGWQWLFIIEAIPAIVLGVVCWFYLTDLPSHATWLAPEERAWLVARMAAERRVREQARDYGVLEALVNPRVLAIAVIYFGLVAVNYGLSFWLPQIVKAFGLNNAQTGLVTAIPYIVGTVSMVLWGRRSDRKMERKGHMAIALAAAAGGIAISGLLPDPVLKMIVLSVAGFGIFAALPVFWTFPTAFLSGTAAAGGIAVINSIGNLSGFAGPYVMGALRDYTGSFTSGLFVIAGAAAVALVIVLLLPHDRRLEEAPPLPAE